MSDLIDRQKAIDALRNLSFEHVFQCGEYYGEDERQLTIINARKAIDVIEAMPSAEPERKIIHCKDCKFYTPMNRKLKTGICAITMHHLGDDGFCSDAERRGKDGKA